MTTIVYWDYILGFYEDNGKENGNYYSILRLYNRVICLRCLLYHERMNHGRKLPEVFVLGPCCGLDEKQAAA